MDISSAERAAKKLSDFVESLASSENKLYSKSKDRLKAVADMCLETVDTIANILQTEMLEYEEYEFENSSPKLEDSMQELARKTDKLKSIASSESNTQTRKALKIPSDKAKEIVLDYKAAFSDLSNLDIQNTTVSRCINIIYKWIDNRLFKQYEGIPKFHYNIYRIKNIIYSIILLYGDAVANDSISEFESMFDIWFSQLQIAPESNKWIAPYPVYELERKLTSNSLDAEDVNLTSILLFEVIWDLELDAKFSKEDSYGVYLSFRHFWNIVSNANSRVLDDYQCYSAPDSEILQRYKIV